MKRLFPWIGILVFVLSLGGYLWAKVPLRRAERLDNSASVRETPAGAEEEWYAVLYQGRRMGYTQNLRSPAGKGEKISEEIHLKMTLMGQVRDVTTRQWILIAPGGLIERFGFEMDSAGAAIRIGGEQAGGKLRLAIYSAGTTQNVDYPVAEPIVMSGNLGREIARAGLTPGKSYTRSFFDPSVMKPSTMRVTVESREKLKVAARTIDVYKLKQTFNGLESTTWIDSAGTIYKEESPTGFSSFRTTREDAMKVDAGAAVDLIAAVSIEARNPPPNPRKVMHAELELGGVDLAGFDLDGGGQRLVGKVLTIDRLAAQAPATDGTGYTRAEPFMQVDDPAVVRATREATGGIAVPADASKRILKWVYENLEKASTVSLPSALEVLHTRQGDCNEHAILYATMARSAGIPARVASGVVALEDHFYYHAWVEILLDGRWLAVDPVFGQYPADATHIRFVLGGLDRQAELMRVIGKLTITYRVAHE